MPGQWTEQLDKIQDLIDTAYADVEADFPDAECGWELDIARSVLSQAIAEGEIDRAVATEWMRQNGWRM